MPDFKSIPTPLLCELTDANHERNMYAHPIALARTIFWQRLKVGYDLLDRFAGTAETLLDFGGGSGVFLPSLAQRFTHVSVVDRDLEDARRIVAHYQLSNVSVFLRDIASWNDAPVFDVIVAMDVLEHFADRSVPRQFIDAHLRRGGLLLVSLPTENWIYELGRLILRKTKPADHYYRARELTSYYQQAGYEPVAYRYVPRIGPFAAPLFYVGLFRKTD